MTDKYLHKALHQLQLALDLAEHGDTQNAVERAQFSISALNESIKELEGKYSQFLLKNILSSLDEDTLALEKIRKEPEGQSSLVLPHLLNRVRKNIGIACVEWKRLEPRKPIIITTFKKVWKYALAGFLLVLFVGTTISLWKIYRHNRQGLFGVYYNGLNFKGKSIERIDPSINFNWRDGSPFKNWRKDGFSVRWTGFLYVPKDGGYELMTHSDDGVRLWIDQTIVIDHWAGHRETADLVMVFLKQGYYPIRLDYYERIKGAVIRLFWKSENESHPKTIKSKYLIPSEKYLNPKIPINSDGNPLF